MTDTFFIILGLRVNNQARSGELFYYLSSAALSMPSSSSNLGYGMQCHPISANRFCVSISLSWFRLIFASQNSRFVLGILQHPSCPCQKHPFTKIQVRYFRNTKSGCPGNRGELSLYRNPLLQSPFRTIISGFVSFPRIAAIFLCRCSAESLSMLAYSSFESIITFRKSAGLITFGVCG